MSRAKDQETADAFATSWNNLPEGSIYTYEQFTDWFDPLKKQDIEGKSVLELGCGNGSFLTHITAWDPDQIVGVDLGDSVKSCQSNMESTGFKNFEIVGHDLITFEGSGFDLVYCIGVLHHLKNPRDGFQSVIRNTAAGGNFHCWVYAKEGNKTVILFVEPLRKISSKLPWRITKYLIATPLSIPVYLYAKFLKLISVPTKVQRFFPLYQYMHWIKDEPFTFFRHVAFDQLVSPQTTFIEKSEIESWLNTEPDVEPGSTYIKFRNGNSWKFGGRKSEAGSGN